MSNQVSIPNSPYVFSCGFENQQAIIAQLPEPQTKAIVVIPAFKEDQLIRTLESLFYCQWGDDSMVEVIIVANAPEFATEMEKEMTLTSVRDFAKQAESLNSRKDLKFYLLLSEWIPKKISGPGIARKIGLDEACKRFSAIGRKNGILISFDADSLCQENYVMEIINHFKKHPKTPGCSIYFEHPLSGIFPDENYRAMIQYELFLRYWINGLKWAGSPYAFQTVGSSFAVTTSAYQKVGGMNSKQAGEDFYFLQKVIQLGGFTNCTTTTVFPSERSSDRVPFGTGRAMMEFIEDKKSELQVFHPEIFKIIKILMKDVPELYQNITPEKALSWYPSELSSFLLADNFSERVRQMKEHSTHLTIFYDRFFRWMNGFMTMKLIHHLRDQQYGEVPVIYAAKEIQSWILDKDELPSDGKSLLLWFRDYDKKNT